MMAKFPNTRVAATCSKKRGTVSLIPVEKKNLDGNRRKNNLNFFNSALNILDYYHICEYTCQRKQISL
jgi:hypothetical protein